jgi:hypothetical protein
MTTKASLVNPESLDNYSKVAEELAETRLEQLRNGSLGTQVYLMVVVVCVVIQRLRVVCAILITPFQIYQQQQRTP